MAVVNNKSNAITSIDAKELVNSNILDGQLRALVGCAVIASGDSATSTYRIGQIPSNARVSQIIVSHPDIGTTTTADVGLYDTSGNGGAVVDADFFAAAYSLKDGAGHGIDVTHRATAFPYNKCDKMLWEALGLSADPKKMYELALTLVGAADAAGDVAVKAYFTI